MVAQVGRGVGAEWYSLDDRETRDAVERDPSGFVRQAPRMIIDEVQRLPELLLPSSPLSMPSRHRLNADHLRTSLVTP
nr:hypothetical protein [Myceligenerans xiligouense]